jgi:multisubunit Na+/H+ antiporter MnhF subunit
MTGGSEPGPRGAELARRQALANLVGTVLGQGLLVLLLVVLPEGAGGRAAACALYLLLAPALAVYLPLRGKDVLAAVVAAGATTIVVNAVVAEVMVATGAWSIRGGVVAVALVSLVLALAGSAAVAARPGPSPTGFEHRAATGARR